MERKVLIVDDDDTLLFACTKIFRRFNCTIDTADSIDKARKLISENDYTIVFSDMKMGNGLPRGGMEVIEFVRNNKPHIKTAIWTAYAEDGLQKRTEADFVIEKPVPSETIVDILRQVGIAG